MHISIVLFILWDFIETKLTPNDSNYQIKLIKTDRSLKENVNPNLGITHKPVKLPA